MTDDKIALRVLPEKGKRHGDSATRHGLAL